MKCPNCNGPVIETSSIAPALVKCQGKCQTTFEAAFVRGYWHNRPELSQDDMILLISAADFCVKNPGFSLFEHVGLKHIADKIAKTIPSEAYQYVDERLMAVYG